MKYLGNNANPYMIAVGPATSQTTSEYIYHRDCIDEVYGCLSQVDKSKPRVIDSEEIAENYDSYASGDPSIIYIKTTIVEAGKVNGDIISTYKVVETIIEGTYAGYTKYSKA